MAIKRFVANADTTITNAFSSNLLERSRGTGSNMGASDVLEVFSIYNQGQSGFYEAIDGRGGASSGSVELSRVLVKFSTDDISSLRSSGDIPASGSVNFYLKMYNAKHASTVPRDFKLVVAAVSQSWEEGAGLDMEEYTDVTRDGEGANWIMASNGTTWTIPGGIYVDEDSQDFRQTVSFDRGDEDLEVDVTQMVEQWLTDNDVSNYGFGIFLSSSYEGYFSSSTADNTGSQSSVLNNLSGSTKSYYTKKLFARGSEYFYKRPIVEARWNSSKKDDRGNFYFSSSLANGADNLNTLYFYNYVRGQLKDIPGYEEGTGNTLFVSLHSGSSPGTREPTQQKLALSVGGNVASVGDFSASAGWIETGVYSASISVTSSTAIPRLDTLYDVWYSSADTSVHYHTGTIIPRTLDSSPINPSPRHVTKITNLKSTYSDEENARFRLYVRAKNWNPNIYTKAVSTPPSELIEDAYYKIIRIADNLTVVNYGTGSANLNYTRLSFDVSGSYFDFDMGMLERDYAYGIKFVYYVNGAYHEQPEIFKFRIE